VVVSEVARRHGLTPQQLFSWRRAARRKAASCEAAPFASVIVAPKEDTLASAAAESRVSAPQPHVIELDVAGASVWIWRGADVGLVKAIVDALKSRRS